MKELFLEMVSKEPLLRMAVSRGLPLEELQEEEDGEGGGGGGGGGEGGEEGGRAPVVVPQQSQASGGEQSQREGAASESKRAQPADTAHGRPAAILEATTAFSLLSLLLPNALYS